MAGPYSGIKRPAKGTLLFVKQRSPPGKTGDSFCINKLYIYKYVTGNPEITRMRSNIIFLVFFLISCGYKGQLVLSTCNAHDSILEKYRNDADRLAVRRVHHTGSNDKDSVKINKSIHRDYLNALIAVHNATTLPANDTITRLLNIHTYNPGLNSIVVLADSNTQWMMNLIYNIYPTRDPAIDRLMNTYFLKKTFYSGLFQPAMMVFKTDTNFNIEPLVKKFENIFGVNKVEPDLLYGDGNDITDSVNSNYTELVYSYGWGDCPNGCLLRRYWRFRVFADCSVEYRGSYGNTLEPTLFLSVEENDKNFKELHVYSNPAKDKLYLECSNNKVKDTKLTLSDKKGNTVYSLKKLNDREEIDLILLSNGLYYLKLQNNAQQKTFKIIKR
jgi:hypothetical protein